MKFPYPFILLYLLLTTNIFAKKLAKGGKRVKKFESKKIINKNDGNITNLAECNNSSSNYSYDVEIQKNSTNVNNLKRIIFRNGKKVFLNKYVMITVAILIGYKLIGQLLSLFSVISLSSIFFLLSIISPFYSKALGSMKSSTLETQTEGLVKSSRHLDFIILNDYYDKDLAVFKEAEGSRDRNKNDKVDKTAQTLLKTIIVYLRLLNLFLSNQISTIHGLQKLISDDLEVEKMNSSAAVDFDTANQTVAYNMTNPSTNATSIHVEKRNVTEESLSKPIDANTTLSTAYVISIDTHEKDVFRYVGHVTGFLHKVSLGGW